MKKIVLIVIRSDVPPTLVPQIEKSLNRFWGTFFCVVFYKKKWPAGVDRLYCTIKYAEFHSFNIYFYQITTLQV